MNRSGYYYDIDDFWAHIRWRGAVKSAIRGKRGQAFLREMLAAMDAMPSKRLIAHNLQKGGEVCAIGTIGVARGIDMAVIDVEDYDKVADVFGVSAALVREIEYENDDNWHRETPEGRFVRVRQWAKNQLLHTAPAGKQP